MSISVPAICSDAMECSGEAKRPAVSLLAREGGSCLRVRRACRQTNLLSPLFQHVLGNVKPFVVVLQVPPLRQSVQKWRVEERRMRADMIERRVQYSRDRYESLEDLNVAPVQ